MNDANEPTGSGGAATDDVAGQVTEEPGHDFGRWLQVVRARAEDAAEAIALQVREHPIRSLMIAAGAGFLLASALRARTVPSIVRTALGIAAAMAVREIAERGMTQLAMDEAAEPPEAETLPNE